MAQEYESEQKELEVLIASSQEQLLKLEKQTVDICFTAVGLVDIPTEQQLLHLMDEEKSKMGIKSSKAT